MVFVDQAAGDTAVMAAALSMAFSCEDGVRVISVSGELDRATRSEFIAVCMARTEPTIIIDLSGLTFMDCGGYASLVEIGQRALAARRSVDVRASIGQPARLIGLIAGLEAADHGGRRAS